jgi:hypothetical protein
MPYVGPAPWHGRCALRGVGRPEAWTRPRGQGEGGGRRGQRARRGARQSDSAQQALHQTRRIHDVAQGVRFGAGDDADVVVGLNLARQQGRAQEVLEHIGDAVQELEDLEGLCVRGAWAQEEQLVLDNRVEQRGRVGVGQVDERRPRRGMRQVEREQGAAGSRPAVVRVLEERSACARSVRACGADTQVGLTCAHRR